VILILSLILVPLAAGLVLLCLKPDLPRKILVSGVTLLFAAAPCTWPLCQPRLIVGGLLNPHWINLVMQFVEIGMSIYIIYVGVRAKRPMIVALALAQVCLMVWFEITQGSIWRWRNNCSWTSSP